MIKMIGIYNKETMNWDFNICLKQLPGITTPRHIDTPKFNSNMGYDEWYDVYVK